MYKSKIFFGKVPIFKKGQDSYVSKADDLFNEWINKHPNIKIVDFEYSEPGNGLHSICILYKEVVDE